MEHRITSLKHAYFEKPTIYFSFDWNLFQWTKYLLIWRWFHLSNHPIVANSHFCDLIPELFLGHNSYYKSIFLMWTHKNILIFKTFPFVWKGPNLDKVWFLQTLIPIFIHFFAMNMIQILTLTKFFLAICFLHIQGINIKIL